MKEKNFLCISFLQNFLFLTFGYTVKKIIQFHSFKSDYTKFILFSQFCSFLVMNIKFKNNLTHFQKFNSSTVSSEGCEFSSEGCEFSQYSALSFHMSYLISFLFSISLTAFISPMLDTGEQP